MSAHNLHVVHPSPGRAPQGHLVTPSRILVVEDEPTIAEAVAARLRAEDFTTVDVVMDGGLAVDRCRDWRPDLVVVDVMLPSLDGHEVCRRSRRRRRAAQRPRGLEVTASHK